MRSTLALLVLVTSGLGAGVASADAPCAPPRRDVVPCALETRTRQVYVAACYEERKIPIYEVSEEPIYGCKMVEDWCAVSKPVDVTRSAPVYEIRRTPVCGMATVPVFAERCRPVMGVDLMSWCEERQVPWLYTRERVQCGVKQVQRVLGYKEEKVPVATAQQICRTEYRVERRFAGYKPEQIIVGTRPVRRVVGHTVSKVLVRPARTDTITETFQRPARYVTVSDAAVRPALLPGTEAVMTEAEFAAAVAATRSTQAR